MKLLVLGGTVYLSKLIAEQAASRGHDVTVAARGHSGEPPAGVRFLPLDREVAASVAKLATESFDAVVDVSRIPGHVGPVVAALADRVGHWTFVSTCGVYARQDIPGQVAATAPVLEPAAADSLQDQDYGNNKVACESLVRDRLGDKAFIVRPGLIVGAGDPNDRFGYWVDRVAAGGEIAAPGDRGEMVQWIDVRDLGGWILDAAQTGRSGTYDGIGAAITRQQFLTGLARALDTDPTFTWLPQEFLLEHGIQPWMGESSLPLWLPMPQYAGFLSRDTSASFDAGLRSRPLADTARHWLAWRDRLDATPPLAAAISRDVETELLTAWHAV